MNGWKLMDERIHAESAPALLMSHDRRSEPRYVPGDANVHLGWWEGEHFRAAPGLLQNFSLGGAAVDIDPELDIPETVWLCVVGPGRVIWTPARLLGREGRVARIQFDAPMPYELFELLI